MPPQAQSAGTQPKKKRGRKPGSKNTTQPKGKRGRKPGSKNTGASKRKGKRALKKQRQSTIEQILYLQWFLEGRLSALCNAYLTVENADRSLLLLQWFLEVKLRNLCRIYWKHRKALLFPSKVPKPLRPVCENPIRPAFWDFASLDLFSIDLSKPVTESLATSVRRSLEQKRIKHAYNCFVQDRLEEVYTPEPPVLREPKLKLKRKWRLPGYKPPKRKKRKIAVPIKPNPHPSILKKKVRKEKNKVKRKKKEKKKGKSVKKKKVSFGTVMYYSKD